MLDIKNFLERTGMKVAENCFLKPSALPYIVFLDNTSISGADDKNCLLDRDIIVELYSEKINKEKAKNQLTFQNEFIIINERHRDVSTISDELLIQEKYSSGWRGAPAKGVDRLRGARVQIPPSPFNILRYFFMPLILWKTTWEK